MARTLSVIIDDMTDEILRRVAAPGQASRYIRAAILEKAARDESRAELDELRGRVERLERRLGLVVRKPPPDPG